ncbi:unnamed protein product [Sympodiomycopsis kandeliae]
MSNIKRGSSAPVPAQERPVKRTKVEGAQDEFIKANVTFHKLLYSKGLLNPKSEVATIFDDSDADSLASLWISCTKFFKFFAFALSFEFQGIDLGVIIKSGRLSVRSGQAIPD